MIATFPQWAIATATIIETACAANGAGARSSIRSSIPNVSWTSSAPTKIVAQRRSAAVQGRCSVWPRTDRATHTTALARTIHRHAPCSTSSGDEGEESASVTRPLCQRQLRHAIGKSAMHRLIPAMRRGTVAVMHSVAILALHGVVPSDLAAPYDVLGRVRGSDGRPAYDVRVCGEAVSVAAEGFEIRAPWTFADVSVANTVIIPGSADLRAPSREVIETVRSAAGRGARIVSICTGAFTLAATGLLDGLRATTHWMATAELARRYPAIIVDPTVLYVDNGNILTSAGAAAGFDLCLHLVRRDVGAAAAAHAARLAVMPLERDGGQAQYIEHPAPGGGGSLEPLLRWIEGHFDRVLRLEDLAQRAGMSVRTLNRRFREQTGGTPGTWITVARIRRAQMLLETSDYSVEEISACVGFESSATLRDRFARIVGISPRGYRRAFANRIA